MSAMYGTMDGAGAGTPGTHGALPRRMLRGKQLQPHWPRLAWGGQSI